MQKIAIRLLILLWSSLYVHNQAAGQPISRLPKTVPFSKGFTAQEVFIRNIGQYGKRYQRLPHLGDIRYGYEGFAMPVLFTDKGMIFLHRKVHKQREEQEERLGREAGKVQVRDACVAAIFRNASNRVKIIPDSAGDAYFTYGMLQEKATGYRRITYQELYPHIDLVIHFSQSTETGFEYTFVIKPGGRVKDIQLEYTGDIKKITGLPGGHLQISSRIGSVRENRPVSFLGSGPGNSTVAVRSSFTRSGLRVGFQVAPYDRSRTLYIDPFVSSTGSLSGRNAGIAKDIDFDYEGNVYVTGGGDGVSSYKLAKYNAAGVLQWTFSGTLATPSWAFGTSYGGWVVEKQTGNVFLGQGIINPSGSRVVRLNKSGLYDNYITAASSNFSENWKMIWSCNNGVPQILIGGGTTSSTNSIGICTPPNTAVDSRNITGGNSFYQDIADMIIDPANNDMYTLFSTGVPSLNNRIYKNAFPYTAASQAWNTATGYNVLNEVKNRPYLSSNAFGDNENSANILAVNNHYLFYWDGKNLKAFSKASGAAVGTPYVISRNLPLLQGGIVADECDNIFIGSDDDTIRVLKFDGNVFDDAAASDLPVTGFPGSVVHDLAYDQGRQLLYVCGNGVVAALDIAGYCGNTTYNLTLDPDCQALTVQAGISPAPPAGTVLTYALFLGTNQLQTNNTGFFSGLTAGNNYTVKVFINKDCGGLQLAKSFFLDQCVFSVTATGTGPTCTGVLNGSITATARFGTPPYLYSIDGVNFQSSNIFTNLGPGTYIITAKDFSGNLATAAPVVLDNSGALQVTVNVANLTCGQTNGSILALAQGGVPPLRYSIDGTNYQPAPLFTGLLPGNYTVSVLDVNNCLATTHATLTIIPPPVLAATATATVCNNRSGSITALATGGSTPYQYSIDGISFQNTGLFTGLAMGNYTVTLKDASDCIRSVPVTVGLNDTLRLDAGNDFIICEGTSQKMPSTSNGSTFSWSPAAGLSGSQLLNPIASPVTTTLYKLTAKEGVCTREDSITVFVNPAPLADAGKDTTVCFGKNVQLNGSGGLTYEWKPSTWLNSAVIPDPVCTQPAAGTWKYGLTVTNINGCRSINADTIIITVKSPAKVFAGNDTAIVINLPFQLQAKDINNVGFSTYTWSPAQGLNNRNIINPVTVLNRDITYTVFAQTPEGCAGADTINIKVYKGPYIYVPNAFTPNNDSRNDRLRALPVGIRSFHYFSVYNRYGQLVFKTTDPRIGWDGYFKGQQQPMGAFTWMVEGVDYRGTTYFDKGTVLLVR